MSHVKENLKGHIGDRSKSGEQTVKSPTSMTRTAADAEKDTAIDVGNAIADVAGQAKDKAQEWASAAGNVVVHTKDTAQDWAHAASDTAQDLGKDVADMIRRYPVPALLVGLGTGFLIGKLTGPHSPARK